jgi:ubiquinone/menaquinone biosynthesis C-methylase UbiE
MSGLLENPIPSAMPFDAIARIYDRTFTDTAIGRAQRTAVWQEMDRAFHRGHRVLEINCGTGVDALHLALRGIDVVACDSAPGMIAQARQRVEALPQLPIRFRCLPTERIDELAADAPYDGVLSNFSGLNCLSDLRPVGRSLSRLIRPGGKVVLCVFGKFCLWEVLWYLSAADTRKALRRFRRDGVASNVAPGASVTVRYWSVNSLTRAFAPYFRLERRRGVGIVSPPSYAASVARRFPRLFRFTTETDLLLGRWPGIRAMADHVVLTFERSKEAGS